MRPLFAAVLAAGLAGLSAGAPPAIDGKAEVPPYKLVRLAATGVGDKAGLVWKVRPQDAGVTSADIDWASPRNGKAITFVAPPGRYLVELTTGETGADGTLTLDGAELLVTVGTPGPPVPPPGPTPPPTPTPTPIPTKLWGVVVVEETDALAAERGRLFTDPGLSALMKAKGYRFRIVDRDVKGIDGQPPADVRRFLDAAKGKAYPQFFVVGSDGKTVASGDLAKDPAALTNTLKQWGGQ